MKCKNHPALACPIGAIGASAHPMAVFSGFRKATDLLHQGMRLVSYCCNAMAIKTASKVCTLCCIIVLLIASLVLAAWAIRSK